MTDLVAPKPPTAAGPAGPDLSACALRVDLDLVRPQFAHCCHRLYPRLDLTKRYNDVALLQPQAGALHGNALDIVLSHLQYTNPYPGQTKAWPARLLPIAHYSEYLSRLTRLQEQRVKLTLNLSELLYRLAIAPEPELNPDPEELTAAFRAETAVSWRFAPAPSLAEYQELTLTRWTNQLRRALLFTTQSRTRQAAARQYQAALNAVKNHQPDRYAANTELLSLNTTFTRTHSYRRGPGKAARQLLSGHPPYQPVRPTATRRSAGDLMSLKTATATAAYPASPAAGLADLSRLAFIAELHITLDPDYSGLLDRLYPDLFDDSIPEDTQQFAELKYHGLTAIDLCREIKHNTARLLRCHFAHTVSLPPPAKEWPRRLLPGHYLNQYQDRMQKLQEARRELVFQLTHAAARFVAAQREQEPPPGGLPTELHDAFTALLAARCALTAPPTPSEFLKGYSRQPGISPMSQLAVIMPAPWRQAVINRRISKGQRLYNSAIQAVTFHKYDQATADRLLSHWFPPYGCKSPYRYQVWQFWEHTPIMTFLKSQRRRQERKQQKID